MTEVVAEIIDPHALTPAQRDALTEELYATNRQIFNGVGRAEFRAYVVDSPARRTRIKILRERARPSPARAHGARPEARGRIVGYAAFHLFECEVAQQRCFVIRGEIGMMPAYRRGSLMGSFMLRETLAARLRHPFVPLYSIVCATNPASYRTINRYSDRVWPHWERPTPPHLAALMGALAEEFHLEPVAGAVAGVYHVGWRPRLGAEEDQALRDDAHPATRFYVARNPGFDRGHGMMSLLSFDLPCLLRSAARLGWRTVCRRRRALIADLQRLCAREQLVGRVQRGSSWLRLAPDGVDEARSHSRRLDTACRAPGNAVRGPVSPR